MEEKNENNEQPEKKEENIAETVDEVKEIEEVKESEDLTEASQEKIVTKDDSKDESITISKDLVYKSAIGILAVLLVLAFFTGGFGFGSKTGNVIAPTGNNDQIVPPTTNVDMDELVDDDAFEGNADAPVTIVEFSDYECPFCGRFYSQTLGLIRTNYIETGKVKLVFRDFPLGFHQQAQKAAEAAECAGEQGKYFDMHDLLFEDGVAGGVDAFKVYATQIGLDRTAFDTCLDTGAMAGEVAQDMRDGQAAGVTGTPGFLINGKLVSGAQPYSIFEQIIESEL